MAMGVFTRERRCGFITMEHIVWENDKLLLLDQRRLPLTKEVVKCVNCLEVSEAIRNMTVRGAPAIGVAAAYAMALAAKEYCSLPSSSGKGSMADFLMSAAEQLAAARPTAINLKWAVDRMLQKADACGYHSPKATAKLLTDEATQIAKEDILANKAIGDHGAAILGKDRSALTYCNAGALATAGYGTALGVIRAAHNQGKLKSVYACETRPYLQGARLTTYELLEDGIEVTLVADNMAGYLMFKGMVDFVIVGADRISLNGDTANKIGTYTLAVLAKEHRIPFYVAAPLSTFDPKLETGLKIPIEERKKEELTQVFGRQIAPLNVGVFNPAFDITPASLITAIITEKGIITTPSKEKIIALLKE